MTAKRMVARKTAVAEKKAPKKTVTKKPVVVKVTPEPEPLPEFAGKFDLHIGQAKGGEASFPIRWCMNPALIDFIKKMGIRNIHILFLTYQNGIEIRDQRKLCRIDEVLDYFTFYRAGKQTVCAHLLWPKNRPINPSCFDKGLFEYLSANTYRTIMHIDLIVESPPYNPNTINQTFCTENHFEVVIGPKAEVEVDIASEFFAQEPPRWLASIAKLGHETPPIDACQFRRRLMANIIFSPVILLLLVCLNILKLGWFSFLLLRGIRGLNWDWITDFAHYTEDWNMAYNSHKWYGLKDPDRFFFIRDRDGHSRPLWFMWLAPICLVPSIALVSVAVGKAYDIGTAIIAGVTFWAGITIILLVLNQLNKLMDRLVIFLSTSNNAWVKGLVASYKVFHQTVQDNRLKLEEEAEAERLNKERQEEESLFNLLTCTPEAAENVSVSFLPKERRTVRLYFLNFKASVCKPFARR